MKIGKYYLSIKSKGELILPGVIILFTLMYLREVLRIYYTDAMLMIRPLITIVLILSAVLMVKQIKIQTIANQKENDVKETRTVFDNESKKLFVFIVATAISLLLLGHLGYIITFGVYSIAMMYYLGVRDIKTLTIVPIGLLIFLNFLFQKWLMVPLPKGFLG